MKALPHTTSLGTKAASPGLVSRLLSYLSPRPLTEFEKLRTGAIANNRIDTETMLREGRY